MEFNNWFGVFAPPGTPPEIVARLNRELNAIMRSPEVIDTFEKAGAEPADRVPRDSPGKGRTKAPISDSVLIAAAPTASSRTWSTSAQPEGVSRRRRRRDRRSSR